MSTPIITYKNVFLQGDRYTSMLPFVGPELDVAKHPSKLSATTKVFSDNLNTMLEHYKLNPTAAGRRCKISQQQMDRFVKCLQSPTLDSVAKVARGFGVAPYQLLIPDLQPQNLATVIAANTLARVSRARELLRDLENGSDKESEGKDHDGGSDPSRPGSSSTDPRRTPHDRRRPQEKKPHP